jgi:hypothetical protein
MWTLNVVSGWSQDGVEVEWGWSDNILEEVEVVTEDVSTVCHRTHTIHFSSLNPLISVLSSLYNHLAQPARLPLSHFSVHPSVLTSSLKLTGRSFSYFAPLLWNNLPPPSGNLPQSHPLILSQIPLTHNL